MNGKANREASVEWVEEEEEDLALPELEARECDIVPVVAPQKESTTTTKTRSLSLSPLPGVYL